MQSAFNSIATIVFDIHNPIACFDAPNNNCLSLALIGLIFTLLHYLFLQTKNPRHKDGVSNSSKGNKINKSILKLLNQNEHANIEASTFVIPYEQEHKK